MKNKKALDWLRVLIFTFLANFFFIVLMKLCPDNIYRNSLLTMCTPMVAHILTRVITREKATVKELLLPANLRGNIKYYLLSVGIPCLIFVVSTIFLIIFFVDDYDIKDCLIYGNVDEFILGMLINISTSFFMFYICMGEEYGWRAYLTPKLETLMPTPLALIVSGIIWGMWHAPIIKTGFNFGTGYKFFPYAGYAGMCLMCIFMGAFFTWLTKKTNSAYPSAIAHTAIDTIQINTFFVPQKVMEKAIAGGQYGYNYFMVFSSGTVIVGAVFFVMLCIDSKKKKSLTEQE